jgi:hypothetical protein
MNIKTKIFFIFCIFVFCIIQTSAQISSGRKYPEASSRLLTSEDLTGKTIWELKIMRNEIFAKYGYKFKSEDMKEYFGKQKWYKPEYDDVKSKFTEIENANIKMIKQYEDDLQKEKSPYKIGELIKNEKREVVFEASWGSGPGELGVSIPEEANPEGPMSFAVDSSGIIYVLDQLNNRVQVYNNTGKHTRSIPISNSTFSDIDFGQSGNLFLLDKWTNKAVLLIDQKGNELKKVGLIGQGIAEAGGASGIYSRQDGLWVEYGGTFVKICDASGKEEVKKRHIEKGLLTRDGRYVIQAKVFGDITVGVSRAKMVGKPKFDNYSIYFDIPVMYITLLDMDKSGNIYLGAALLDQSRTTSPPYTIDESHEVVVVLDSNGIEKRKIYMPVSTGAEEVLRSIRLTADGTLYQLVTGGDATMWRYIP